MRLVLSSAAALSSTLTACAPSRVPLADPADPRWTERAPDQYSAQFRTSKGTFVIEVNRSWAPHGADRFYTLVLNGFYDEQRFTRVIAGFIAQWGLSGQPGVTAAWKGRAIPDDPVRQSNRRGFVAFAMTGPHTRTTHVYISYGDNSRLDTTGFAPFGRVVLGMDVVDSLNAEYGDSAGGGIRGGRQGPIEQGGNAYLRKTYPRLDYIIRATIVRPGVRGRPATPGPAILRDPGFDRSRPDSRTGGRRF